MAASKPAEVAEAVRYSNVTKDFRAAPEGSKWFDVGLSQRDNDNRWAIGIRNYAPTEKDEARRRTAPLGHESAAAQPTHVLSISCTGTGAMRNMLDWLEANREALLAKVAGIDREERDAHLVRAEKARGKNSISRVRL